uniref:Uncharacterized protein n=1 Tax=Anguilla anguilla TaxID=7936 RepID=A0A0E9WZQ5_ANGAN
MYYMIRNEDAAAMNINNQRGLKKKLFKYNPLENILITHLCFHTSEGYAETLSGIWKRGVRFHGE